MNKNNKNLKKNINQLFLMLMFAVGFIGFLKAQNEEIILWDAKIPGSIEAMDYNEDHNRELDQVRKITQPTLAVFLPENPNGTAVVICPGGGYAFLAIKRAGYDVAKWLSTQGITAFVLKYRLPSDDIMQDKSIGPLQDAQESIRYLRRHAKKWKLDTEKIGIMGSSAGGHLASTLSTHYNDKTYISKDNTSAKPNFSVLIYPVISMDDKITHKGSRKRLLGINPSKALIEKFSNEKHIDSLTPPTFLVHATDDKTVPVENSIAYYLALKNNNIPAELHVYQNGKHGFFLGKNGTSKNWTKHCEAWLRFNNYIN